MQNRTQARPPRDPVVEAYKAHVDRGLLRVNLRRSPDERLRALVEMARFADEVREAGERAREDSPAPGRDPG